MARIRLDGVSVEFPVYDVAARSMRRFGLAALGGKLDLAGRRASVTALASIDLELKEGDRLALSGPNGAGKTTLLRTLAGIYAPTAGRRTSTGRIAALLGTHAGLDLDATGLENIMLLGIHLDIPPRDMRRNVPEIVEWAGLGPFIAAPLRTYSAGMITRLAFAVVTARPPEILLMDEWLGLGDAEFQVKAYERMSAYVGGASILVLASHAQDLLTRWCTTALRLDGGRIVRRGSVAEVLGVAETGLSPPPPAC